VIAAWIVKRRGGEVIAVAPQNSFSIVVPGADSINAATFATAVVSMADALPQTYPPVIAIAIFPIPIVHVKAADGPSRWRAGIIRLPLCRHPLVPHNRPIRVSVFYGPANRNDIHLFHAGWNGIDRNQWSGTRRRGGAASPRRPLMTAVARGTVKHCRQFFRWTKCSGYSRCSTNSPTRYERCRYEASQHRNNTPKRARPHAIKWQNFQSAITIDLGHLSAVSKASVSIWNRIRNSRLLKGRSRAAHDRGRRRLAHEPLEARDLLAFGDVVVDFKFVNSGGTPVSSLQVGQDFTLQVNVRDGQAVPEGVLRAYLDFTYPAALATVRGPITHGANYNLSVSGDASTPGLIDEAGGLDTDAFPPSSPGDSFLLFSLPMRAASAGTLTLTADPADGPTRDVRLFDFTEVPLNEIRFVNSSIAIAGAGINVSPTSGLTTTEIGGTAQFTVVLSTQPTANVTINLSSNDLTEGTVSPASLTFTTSNWNTPRTVTVTGVNDAIDDGNVLYTIVTAPRGQHRHSLQWPQSE